MDELVARVGRNMARIRRERGLSQERFAAELGIHRTYVGGVEQGRRNLTLQTVEKLAGLLGVPVEDLFR